MWSPAGPAKAQLRKATLCGDAALHNALLHIVGRCGQVMGLRNLRRGKSAVSGSARFSGGRAARASRTRKNPGRWSVPTLAVRDRGVLAHEFTF
jgi:hypothetical protein